MIYMLTHGVHSSSNNKTSACFSSMECCSPIQRIPTFEALPTWIKHKTTGFSSSSLVAISQSRSHVYPRLRSRSSIVAVATNSASTSCKLSTAVAPLQLSSSEGKFLSYVLQSKPHLFLFAVSEQLDELVSDREAAAAIKKPSSFSMETLLYRRIAEMKERERQTAIQDIMYVSIVHKFSEIQVPMVPKLSECISNRNQEIWSSKCRELESIHSVEVQEMIREHLSTILLRIRGKSSLLEISTAANIDRLHLGEIYASSVMYGYFFKSACFRREMDSSLAQTVVRKSNTDVTPLCQESRRCENLRNYVHGFNSETLQRCAKLKSQVAANLIEKHTWALFGDEKIGQVGRDRQISVTFSYLERLILEAVSFGSFLWDVERDVDSIYTLSSN